MAFALGGKVHLLEADTRTDLHPRNENGRLQNLTESLAAIRREFSTALVEGAALWFCDFGPGDNGGWFDDPAMMKEIARLYALAGELIRQPRRRTAEVALVCDPGSAYVLTDSEGMATAYHLINDFTTELYCTGALFDTIYLSQCSPRPQAGEGPGVRVEFVSLQAADLFEYVDTRRSTDCPTPTVTKGFRSGHALALAAGTCQPAGISAEQASRLTGFDLELLRTRLPGQIEIRRLRVWRALRTGSGQHFVFDNHAPFGPVLAAPRWRADWIAPRARSTACWRRKPRAADVSRAPFAPRQLLAAHPGAAGVHRYDTQPGGRRPW